ncbi:MULTISPECIES: FxsA family protein [Thiomicrorhabdus]|uniref:FxsA family protein n=1 Tax=Thiomicrorhabdus heinhorstiae TaxID=2748010 RepID=A0ABS0BYM9_9GAMM|nr:MULTISPECIES: FxsA family protein [Thiomicrorhabdus]MBF6058193.1 FxsA family protein [Thiomicrorhabdus heinhorstiae]
MRFFFLLFIAVPLVELYFLIQVGSVIGALPTVLLTIFTAVLGVYLMRSQGVDIMMKAQRMMAQGEAPQEAIFEGVFIFIGGVLLLIPGLITDALGFLFLVPPVRRYLIKQSFKGLQVSGRYSYRSDDNVFEGEWQEKTQVPPSRIEGTREDDKRRDL